MGATGLAIEKGSPYTQIAEFQTGDFFALPEKYGGGIDLAFDYTFLCALTPDLRQTWAKTYANLLSKNGKLVTVIFPLSKEDNVNGGPPFIISLQLARELLEPLGLECVHEAPIQTSIA